MIYQGRVVSRGTHYIPMSIVNLAQKYARESERAREREKERGLQLIYLQSVYLNHTEAKFGGLGPSGIHACVSSHCVFVKCNLLYIQC